MKITEDQLKQAIDVRLPAYFWTSNPLIQYDLGEKYPGGWFSLQFGYPGSTYKYCWVSIKDDMTEDELDEWATAAAVQIKLTQQIDEFEERAKELTKLTNS